MHIIFYIFSYPEKIMLFLQLFFLFVSLSDLLKQSEFVIQPEANRNISISMDSKLFVLITLVFIGTVLYSHYSYSIFSFFFLANTLTFYNQTLNYAAKLLKYSV